MRTGLLSITLVGFAFSAYLTYREAFSIHAYCEWCLSSAAIMTVLAGLSITRFVRGDDPAADAPGGGRRRGRRRRIPRRRPTTTRPRSSAHPHGLTAAGRAGATRADAARPVRPRRSAHVEGRPRPSLPRQERLDECTSHRVAVHAPMHEE